MSNLLNVPQKNNPANNDEIIIIDRSLNQEARVPISALPQSRNGLSVQVQYSADAVNWTDVFLSGSVYMRQRLEGTAWSEPIKMSLSEEDINKLQVTIAGKLSGEITSLASDVETKASKEALKITDDDVDSLRVSVNNIAQKQIVIDDIKDIDEIKSVTFANIVVHRETSISYYNNDSEDLQTELIFVNSGLFLCVGGVGMSYNSASQHNIKQTLSYYSQEGYWVEYMRVYSVFSAAWTNWFQVSKINMGNGKW